MIKFDVGSGGPFVVLLHGFAGCAEDLAPFARSMGVDARFVFPEGFVDLKPLGFSGRAWWPSDGQSRSRAMEVRQPRDLSNFEPDGLESAREMLTRTLDDLAAESAGRPLTLGGFSQGAMLALDLALRSDRPIAGLVQLSGSRIAARTWMPRLQSRRGMRVFISHGRGDPDLSFEAAQAFQDDLIVAGWNVEFCPFEGGHEIPLAALRGLKSFLRKF